MLYPTLSVDEMMTCSTLNIIQLIKGKKKKKKNISTSTRKGQLLRFDG